MVSGLIENLGLVCENEGGDDNEVDTGLADEGRITPTIDSINVIQTPYDTTPRLDPRI